MKVRANKETKRSRRKLTLLLGAVLREQGKGGCPFIEARNRSSAPPAAAPPSTVSAPTPASTGAPSSIAAHATAGGDISQCPFFNPALKKNQAAAASPSPSS